MLVTTLAHATLGSWHARRSRPPSDPAGTRESEAEESALAAALASVGDRWTLLVISALLDGPRRFGDLQDEVTGIAPNVLTQRLRRLETEGLVIAQPYSERPPRFVYELSRPDAAWPASSGCWRTGAPGIPAPSPAARRLRHTAGGGLVLPDMRGPRRPRGADEDLYRGARKA